MGHIRHLTEAKSNGDALIVTITADAFVNKGPSRPAFTGKLRAEMLAALEIVDFVAINHAPDAEGLLRRLRPDIYAKGSDYREDADVTGKIRKEREAVEAHSGRIVFTNDITFSSSELLNRHFELFDPQVKEFLDRMRSDGGLDAITALIAKCEVHARSCGRRRDRRRIQIRHPNGKVAKRKHDRDAFRRRGNLCWWCRGDGKPCRRIVWKGRPADLTWG